ncbi:T9SS type A sorting domain-containing protein [Dyadobacter chenwenxiniae]|uniref:T9SS type A sorting domain-containing protein n=1 Tax=Dyadobacter chenwenxiniae TaxID=2906456 RepID=A0A9X1PRT1_9BACT|nr:T9SS type A sorting domain-containing protein [Dyadobacter chenwenxiniae]MCF0065269.1 T9SS type A sorting domain-containing protein [Dyadobacter chenwenxiniae]UON84463.1 T9SS type A sorting domain-containing protein [Dyadobacter chenwenxiniae]
MKHFFYLTFLFLISLNGYAEDRVNPTLTTVTARQELFQQCIEAESQPGNGPITSDPNASNGQTRGSKDNYDHYVDYAVNGVKATGTHQVKVRYYASGAAQAAIAVNGNVAIPSANFPATHSWNIVWREETFNVMLNQGNNVLRIQGLPGRSIRQDQICVTGGGGQGPVCDFNIAPTTNQPIYEREKPMTLSANCTGGDCATVTYTWTGNGITASGETVNLTSPSVVGNYAYTLTASKPGCPDQVSTVAVNVDWALAPCRYYFYPSLQDNNPTCNSSILIYAHCPEYDCDNVTYTWNGPGANNQVGQAINLITPDAIGSYNYVVTASKPGCETRTVNYTLNIRNCTPPANEDFDACLESENQNGSAPVSYDPNASGSQARGDKDNYNNYVDYAVEGVPVDGLYEFKLRYAASSGPSISVRVNDTYVIFSKSLPATHSWNIVFREEILMLTLKAGSNVVRIQGEPGASIRQDKVCISNVNTNTARMGAPETGYMPSGIKDTPNVFPNPAPGEFNAKFNLTDDEGKITVTDVRGNIWYDVKVKGKGAHDEKVRMKNAPAGIYFMKIRNGDKTTLKKVLITR